MNKLKKMSSLSLSLIALFQIKKAIAGGIPVSTDSDPFEKTSDLLDWATESLTGIIGTICVLIILICATLTIFGKFPARLLGNVILGSILATSATFIAELIFD
ncbi:MAG: TrbC/VirB2 family protein [Bacilli bacterium]